MIVEWNPDMMTLINRGYELSAIGIIYLDVLPGDSIKDTFLHNVGSQVDVVRYFKGKLILPTSKLASTSTAILFACNAKDMPNGLSDFCTLTKEQQWDSYLGHMYEFPVNLGDIDVIRYTKILPYLNLNKQYTYELGSLSRPTSEIMHKNLNKPYTLHKEYTGLIL